MRKCIVDANHLAARCWATMNKLVTTDGKHSGVIHGFIRGLFYMQKTLRISTHEVTICWDSGRSPMRMAMYPDYKGNRPEAVTEEEIFLKQEYYNQLAALKAILPNIGYRCIAVPNTEADDLIGLVCGHYSKNNIYSVVYSGDKDFHQLTSDLVSIWNGKDLLTKEAVMALWSVPEPGYVPWIRAMIGDSSDNIGGINGIGEKRAIIVLHHILGIKDALPKDMKYVILLSEHYNILMRNLRLMKIPTEWDASICSNEEYAKFIASLDIIQERNDLESVKFFQHWQLEQALESVYG